MHMIRTGGTQKISLEKLQLGQPWGACSLVNGEAEQKITQISFAMVALWVVDIHLLMFHRGNLQSSGIFFPS